MTMNGRLPAAAEPALAGIVRDLEHLVITEMEPGAQLPAEADLARRYGVSRLTVREALKILVGRGLVELSRGRRAAVREPDSSILSSYLSIATRRDARALFELNEIRQALEVLSVSLAARSATRASLAALEAALQRMAEVASPTGTRDPGDYATADISFHEALALASGNRMLAFMLEGLADALRLTFLRSTEGHFTRGGSWEDNLGEHRKLLERVRQGDARGAAQTMRAHLRASERDLKAAIRNATSE